MDASVTILSDEAFLTIVREDKLAGRARIHGEADLDRISETEIRARARELGLVLSYIDPPSEGPFEWSKLCFARREVPETAKR